MERGSPGAGKPGSRGASRGTGKPVMRRGKRNRRASSPGLPAYRLTGSPVYPLRKYQRSGRPRSMQSQIAARYAPAICGLRGLLLSPGRRRPLVESQRGRFFKNGWAPALGFEPRSGTPQAPRISVLPHAGPNRRNAGRAYKIMRWVKGRKAERQKGRIGPGGTSYPFCLSAHLPFCPFQ